MPASTAIVSCIPGWDGGLEQTFTLEVRESKNKHSRILAAVQHSPVPHFNLRNLKHREHYLFIITAVNARGTSPPVTVSYITPLRELSPLASNAHTGDKTSWISWTSIVAVVFGVMLTILACMCAVIGLMKFKSSAVPTSSKASATIVYAGSQASLGARPEKLEQCNELPPNIVSPAKCKDFRINIILLNLNTRCTNFEFFGIH